MSLGVRLRRDAERDVEEAAQWYERQRLGLGQQFLDEVLRTLQKIGEQPDLYPVVHRSTRRALIHKFPFGIYYRVQQSAVVVVAVMHGSRHPGRWRRRT